MAQQTIGLGSAPNDGTGDDLRTGGDKINDNFSELYSLIGSFINKGGYTWPHLWTGTTGAAKSANVLYFAPIVIPTGFSADRIAIVINATVAGNARLGIYNNRNSVNLPGTLVLDAGTVATDGATGEAYIAISQALDPGKYWLAAVFDAAANVLRCTGGFPMGANALYSIGVAQSAGLYRNFTYAALPADESAKIVTDYTKDTLTPYITLRRA